MHLGAVVTSVNKRRAFFSNDNKGGRVVPPCNMDDVVECDNSNEAAASGISLSVFAE